LLQDYGSSRLLNARMTLVRLHRAEGADEEAIRELEAAAQLAEEMDDRRGAAIVAVFRAELTRTGVREAEREFERSDPRLEVRTRTEARFLLWKATSDTTHLEEAHRLLCHLRDHAPEEFRETMIENVPLHREITAAWEKHRAAD
jgi:hypothetical protein